MLASYKLVFNRRNVPLRGNYTALIQLRMTLNRQARYFSTGLYINKHQWADKEGAWVVGHTDAPEYNAFLTEVLSRVRKANALSEIDAQSLSYEAVKRIVRNDVDTSSFVDFMELESQARSDIGPGAKARARVMVRKLKRFGITRFSDLTFENIARANNELLKSEMVSTVDKFHAMVLTYINRAVRLGLMPMDKNPYVRFKRSRPKEGERKYLTPEELQKIETKELPILRLAHVRDIFLFSCYTGLSYSDAQALTPGDIQDTSGRRFIKISRRKTDEAATIFLLAKAAALLEKYDEYRAGYCLPSISNQRMNAYLKEIATLCGVEKDLTSHMARHTFATTIMLAGGVSLEVTQKALGHANIRTTQIYAKMLDDRVADEMSKIDK